MIIWTLQSKEWAWVIAVVVLSMGIVITAVQMAITKWMSEDIIGSAIEIVINGIIILYYLFRPHVKAYVRRVTAY